LVTLLALRKVPLQAVATGSTVYFGGNWLAAKL
jgi:hypothetical protein